VNTSDPPTLAERLARVPNGALSVRLSLAHTRMMYGQTMDARAKALEELDAINTEMQRRGLKVTA
jgi:hypothetical protein